MFNLFPSKKLPHTVLVNPPSWGFSFAKFKISILENLFPRIGPKAVSLLSSFFIQCWMNLEKQHAKLLKLQAKADACTDRKEALKILKKSDKVIHKLSKP